MRTAILLACAAALTGCVSARTSVVYGSFTVPADRPSTFCENYAEQTYRNALRDVYEPGEGFGSRQFARATAERAAARAYDRCLSGRLN